MILNSSSMDRPAVAQRRPRALLIGVAAALLLAALAFAIPAARRWSSAERAVDAASLRFAAARRSLGRVERTSKEGLSNKVDYETAQDNVRIAAMELDQARNELGLTGETGGFELATREQQVRRQESVTGELQKRVDDL